MEDLSAFFRSKAGIVLALSAVGFILYLPYFLHLGYMPPITWENSLRMLFLVPVTVIWLFILPMFLVSPTMVYFEPQNEEPIALPASIAAALWWNLLRYLPIWCFSLAFFLSRDEQHEAVPSVILFLTLGTCFIIWGFVDCVNWKKTTFYQIICMCISLVPIYLCIPVISKYEDKYHISYLSAVVILHLALALYFFLLAVAQIGRMSWIKRLVVLSSVGWLIFGGLLTASRIATHKSNSIAGHFLSTPAIFALTSFGMGGLTTKDVSLNKDFCEQTKILPPGTTACEDFNLYPDTKILFELDNAYLEFYNGARVEVSPDRHRYIKTTSTRKINESSGPNN